MSADEEIGKEIGRFLLILLGGGVAAIAFAIYLWHHVHFTW